MGTGRQTQRELVEPSRIIEVINDRFGTDFDEEDQYLFDQVTERMTADEEVRRTARVNDREHFEDATRDQLKHAIFEHHDENRDIVTRIAKDEEFGGAVIDLLLMRVYDEVQEEV